MYIAVTSGKGGTGKTLISTSLALSSPGSTYVDLDVEEPNGYIFMKPQLEKEIDFEVLVPQINHSFCTLCGQCANNCAFNALTIVPLLKKSMLFPELCHSCGLCSYVCTVTGAIKEVKRKIGTIRFGQRDHVKFLEGRLDIGQPSGVPLIGGILHNYLEKGGIVITDTSPGTSCSAVESLKESDYVLLVTEPTPFGLNDLTLIVELVKKLGKKAGLILNKDNNKSRIIDDFARNAGIPILLRIPYSMDIQKSYSRGEPLVEAMPEMKQKFHSLVEGIVSNT